MHFWYIESPGELKENIGYAKRLNYLNNIKTLQIYGGLLADLFNSDKMLINGVDMNIKLTCAPATFYLLASS